MNENKPNIVLIMADQMAPDVVAALGHPAVKTPNIDRLVESGVTFDNAYCNSPICAPSRASFVSGKHISEIEIFDNGSELSADTPTFLHHLRRGGYETVLAGKMHFVGPDQLHGFEKRVTTEIHTAAFDLTPDWSEGVYHNHGTGVERLKNPGVSELNNNLDYDEKVVHRTLEQIRTFKRTKNQRPFFLCSSYFHPHDPFHITDEYWRMYEDADIPMPEIPEGPLDDMHPFNQWIQKHHERDICKLTEEEIHKNRRAYYGMVTYFDDKVGQIVRELERLEMMDNTIIMVTSDHGEMLGEHGMWFKRTFYDPAAKVPLIISRPGMFPQGKRVQKVVSLVDLAATIMELADVPDRDEWTAEMDGDSFAKLLREGHDDNWKDEAICEYYGEGPIQPMVMLRKGRYKYVHVHEHNPLLFDLETDPQEINNLAENKNYKHVLNEFSDRIMDNFDLKEIREKITRSQRERILVADALRTGKKTSWDHKIDN
ncbi:choline-sulfatase [Thalassobacillus pellis]|uniref:choline-sulfatase n=1 Tax=Thalassobacillus pellis TaxID=748008 RepID=UPI00195F8C20|nr:choline-sulfatase [Thalassobacillus pellis]MBM7551548.1 choline-sulfatase [Thalassobacillus pellis]